MQPLPSFLLHVHSVYSYLVRTLIQLTGYLKPEHVSPCQSQTYPLLPPLACHSFQAIRIATSLNKGITPMFFLTSTALNWPLVSLIGALFHSNCDCLQIVSKLLPEKLHLPPFLSPPHRVCSSLSYRDFLSCTVCVCVQYTPVSNSVPVEILT